VCAFPLALVIRHRDMRPLRGFTAQARIATAPTTTASVARARAYTRPGSGSPLGPRSPSSRSTPAPTSTRQGRGPADSGHTRHHVGVLVLGAEWRRAQRDQRAIGHRAGRTKWGCAPHGWSTQPEHFGIHPATTWPRTALACRGRPLPKGGGVDGCRDTIPGGRPGPPPWPHHRGISPRRRTGTGGW